LTTTTSSSSCNDSNGGGGPSGSTSLADSRSTTRARFEALPADESPLRLFEPADVVVGRAVPLGVD
jgi:hypothetical protein